MDRSPDKSHRARPLMSYAPIPGQDNFGFIQHTMATHALEKKPSPDGLILKAEADLQTFRVRLSLGKMEARDVFEDLKKELHGLAHKAKTLANDIRASEDLRPLVNALEHLQVQLSLGVAEGRREFEQQKRKIYAALRALENDLEQAAAHSEELARVKKQFGKLRTKLGLLALHWKLRKIKAMWRANQVRKSLLAQLHRGE